MVTNVKNKEFNLLVGQLSLVFRDKVGPFRYDLKVVRRGSGVSEVPKSKMFGLVSDILTLKEFVAMYGEWVMAEVEGLDVQFNPLVPVEAETSVADSVSPVATPAKDSAPKITGKAARKQLVKQASQNLKTLDAALKNKASKNKAKSTAKMAEFPLNTNGADKSLD